MTEPVYQNGPGIAWLGKICLNVVTRLIESHELFGDCWLDSNFIALQVITLSVCIVPVAEHFYPVTYSTRQTSRLTNFAVPFVLFELIKNPVRDAPSL